MDVKAFPENINFRSMRGYAVDGEVKDGGYTSSLWEVGASWFLLPEKPMRQRMFDDRVGYFTFAPFKENNHNNHSKQIINIYK